VSGSRFPENVAVLQRTTKKCTKNARAPPLFCQLICLVIAVYALYVGLPLHSADSPHSRDDVNWEHIFVECRGKFVALQNIVGVNHLEQSFQVSTDFSSLFGIGQSLAQLETCQIKSTAHTKGVKGNNIRSWKIPTARSVDTRMVLS